MPTVPQFTIVSIIGLVLTLSLWYVKWRTDKAEALKKQRDDIDKQIDSSATSDDLLRRFQQLRDK